MKKASNLVYSLVFIFLVLVAGIVALSSLKIPGNFKLLTVESGSMEPAIKRGAIVVVKPESDYHKGDVITVVEPANPKISLTHRIVEIEEQKESIFYTTKGDANEAPDTEKRPKENVVGKVLFSIPLVGYPVAFAKTRDGLLILVIIPATVIIYSELMSIKNETKKLLAARKNRKLSLQEKVELEIGEEEIKAQKWYHKLLRKLRPKQPTIKTVPHKRKT